MGLITAPTIVVAIDDTFDTSVFYSITEEEESGKFKNLISPFSLQNNDITSNFEMQNHQFFTYRFKNYSKPHLNLISPPPEQDVL